MFFLASFDVFKDVASGSPNVLSKTGFEPTLTMGFEPPPYGGQPFVIIPRLADEKVTTGKTGTILCLRSGHKINRFLAIQTLRVFPVVIFSSLA